MHYYNLKSFTQEQEQVMRQIATPSFAVDDFLNDKEFNILQKIVAKGINWNEIGQVSKYHGFSWSTEYGPLLKWLQSKIDSVLENWELDFLAFQEGIVPWKIHADIRWYDDKIPYKMLLLPINVISKSSAFNDDNWPETYTIVFKQRNYLSYYKNLQDNYSVNGHYGNSNQDSWPRPIDDPGVENLTDNYSVTEDEWKKYFTHIPYEYFKGLEIDSIYKWKPKSLLGWDCSSLHCADDFLLHNIVTKKCLIIGTIYKK